MLKKLNNKKIVIISLCIMVLLLVIGTSVALWTRAFTQTGVNTNTTDCFNVTFSEGSSISQTNLYPQTDEEGLTNTPYQVTITNTCNIAASYNVVLHKDNASTLANNHIKVAVDNNTKLLSSLTSKTSSINSSTYTAYDIGLGVVPGKTSKTINIRSWMEANTSQSDGENKTFNYKITIEATPNSNLLAAKVLTTNRFWGFDPTYKEVDSSNVYPSSDEFAITRRFKSNITNIAVTRTLDDVAVANGYTQENVHGTYTLTDLETISSSTDPLNKYYCVSARSVYISNTTCTLMAKVTQTEYDSETGTYKVTQLDRYRGEEDTEVLPEYTGIYATEDEEGMSYYLRGFITNNYVSFAGSLWQVVRINGNGSIRLMRTVDDYSVEDEINSAFNQGADIKYSGYTYDNDHVCTRDNPCSSTTGTSSIAKAALDNYYQNNIVANNLDNKVEEEYFCNDTSITNEVTHPQSGSDYAYFSFYERWTTGTPSLKCNNPNSTYGGLYKLKIGLISGDEQVYAGAANASSSVKPFIFRNINNYNASPVYFLLSFGGVITFITNSDGYDVYITTDQSHYNNIYIIPVINLKSDVVVSGGDGSQSNPYIVE